MSSDHHKEILAYIEKNPIAILGTIGKGNMPHGAAVYICATSPNQLYFVTKTETQKFKNIQLNPEVSITIVNPAESSSLQASGIAHVVSDPDTIEMVLGRMVHIYATSPDWLPPISKLRAGPYQIVGIQLTFNRLAEFLGKHPGSEHIFKEN